MVRRFVAQVLTGWLVAGVAPVAQSRSGGPVGPVFERAPTSAVAAPESSWPAASAAGTAPAGVPSQPAPLAKAEAASSAVAELHALPLPRPSQASRSAASAAAGPALRLLKGPDAPAPGIQKSAARQDTRTVEVQPPQAPHAALAHAPDQFAAAAARSEERALPPAARLSLHPGTLRFALTDSGVVPAAQRLEITGDRREGVRFEVSSGVIWLRLANREGKAGMTTVAVEVAVDGRGISGSVSGLLEVRNLDNPSEVQQIAVEVERVERALPLRSVDADGRLQRLVRPDGSVLDYDYDSRGRLVRVRRPDGSAVSWAYDQAGRRTSMSDGRGTTVYRYDAEGRLDTVYAPGFEPVRYGHDEQGRLTQLTLPGGRVVAYEYDAADRLLSVRGELGTTRYAYDAASGRLAARTLPDGVVTEYGYDGAGRLIEVSHHGAAGAPLLAYSWQLDDQGRPVTVARESPAGRETADIGYDEKGRIASVAEPSGRMATYAYDGAGRRSRVVETAGASVAVVDYVYDDLGRLARVGGETFAYDAAGDLVRRSSPGQTREYRWDSEGRLIGFADGRHQVAYELDGDGRRTAVAVDGAKTLLLQDLSGWIGGVLAEAGEDGRVLNTHVYGFEPLAVEGQAGEGSFYLYDHPLHAAAALATPGGQLAETFASDPFGELRTQPDAGLPGFLFAGGPYDARTGLVELHGRQYDPALAAYLTSGLDAPDGAAGVPSGWAAEVPTGAFSEAQVRAFRPQAPAASQDRGAEPTAGAASGPASPSGAEGKVPREVALLQSNELPRAGSVQAPRLLLPSPYRAQPEEGAVYRRGTLPQAQSTPTSRLALQPEYLPFAKTAAGLLPTSQSLQVASSDGQPLAFTLTAGISWLTVSAASGTTPAALTVTANPSGLTEQGSPYVGDLVLTNTADPTDVRKVRVRLTVRATGAAVTLRSFDANGNLRRVIKPDGGIVDYSVDALGRVTQVSYPNQPAVSYAYDGNGNPISMTDQRGTTSYQYDRQNRLTGVFTPLGTNFIPVYYGYDNAGHLTSLATPDNRTVLYAYDADGRMIRVTDGTDVTGYTYDGTSGRLASQTLPNGITTTYTYDTDGRLTDVVHKAAGGALLMGFHYVLNAVGQRTSATKQTPAGSEVTSYAYDARRFLKSVTYPDGKQVAYTYDALGNRLTMTTVQGSSSTVVNYVYDHDNRLLQAGSEIFAYDANGNLVRRSSASRTVAYTYDARNLLTKVDDGFNPVTLEYDGDGARIAKTAGGQRINFINDSGGSLAQVLVEADASWQVLHGYGYGIQRISQRSPASAQFYLQDAASVVALADAAANLSEVYRYDSFGFPSGNSGGNPYLFDGEAFDAETSLIYLRARYFDPSLGRFLGRDPVLGSTNSPDTFNPYVFADDDPVNLADPSGLDTFQLGGQFSYSIVSPAKINQYSFSLQGILGINTWNPLDWRFGFTTNLAGGHSWGTPGIALGVLVSQSEAAKPQYLAGPAVYAGGLLADEGAIGGQASYNVPRGPLVRSVFVGLGAGDSVDAGASNTWVFDTSLRDIGNAIGKAWQKLFGGSSSSSQPSSSFLDSTDHLTGGISYSSYQASDLGGVDLNKTASLLLSLQDVSGATFDAATGQIVLLGHNDVTLPPLDMNHVAVAVQSEYAGQDPGVSIEPPIVNSQMSVRFVGATSNTMFGDLMFQADRTLKILTLGEDNVTRQPVTSSVPGYQNMLQRRLAAGCNGLPTTTRMWFQPKEVRLVPSTDGKSMVFDSVSMELLYESKVGSQVVSDPVAAAFADHFTRNYEAFAAEWPILKKLEQLGKVVAIVKWIKENHIPIDLSFLAKFPIQFFSTTTATPAVTVQGTTSAGGTLCTISLQGGVSYVTPNTYSQADPAAGAALAEALAQRPSEGTFKWTYQPAAATAPAAVTAVSQSLTRSRHDGNTRFRSVDLASPLPGGGRLALVRTYSSFRDLAGPLGPGWSVLPAELRFPVDRETFTFGSANLALSLYGRIWVTEQGADREDAYDLLGIDSANLPIYQRADIPHVLRQQADGTFLLARTDGSTARFRADGKPLALTDRNGNAVTVTFDAQTPDRLLHLDAAGQTITLAYDGQGRLTGASGPGNRQVTYAYDAQGNLSTVTDAAGRSRSFAYDAGGRLTSATDAAGQTVFSASYDDYARTPSRKIGAAGQYGMGFNLAAGQTTVTDPFGRTTQRTFERRQLASPSGLPNEVVRPTLSIDPLGNRSTTTWANDAFGPRTVTNAQGGTAQLAWDNRGHLTTVQDPLGKQSQGFYDPRDRLVAVQDPEGLATGYGYDDRNNLTAVYHDVSLTLDASGNLASFGYNPANVTSLGYDGAGNLTSAANPQGQPVQVARNAAGQPTQVATPAGVVTSLAYDPLSAQLATSQTGSQKVTYGYDGADQVVSITTAAGATTVTRDVHERVTRVTDALGQATAYAYDADGNLTQVTDPAGNVTTYSYDALGHLLTASLPNGTSNAWEYDELGRPVGTLTGLGPVAPHLALAETALDFGTAAVGSSRQLPLDLDNQGTATLTVSGITVSAPFSVAFSGPVTIAPGGSLQVAVSFTPTDGVSSSANLSVTSDDPAAPVQLVALTGSGARKVVNLHATPQSDGIFLTWDTFVPGAQSFAHFAIYRSTTPIPGDVTGLAPFDLSLTSAAANSFKDSLATPGTSYYYAVTAVYTNGDENKSVDPAGPVAYFTSFGPLAADLPLATAPQSEDRPAIAYNSAANEYLVVYELQTTATNSDIYGQRVAANGALLGSAFAIANSSHNERHPRLAYNSKANNYLVIYEYDASGNGTNYDLQARPVAANGALSAIVTVANSASQDLSPEIAFGSVAGEYLVAYETDPEGDGKTDVGCLRLSAAGAVLASVYLTIKNSSGVVINATKPHLAYNSTLNDFMFAFEVDAANNGSNIEIWETRLTPAPAFVDGILYYVAHGTGNDRHPFLTYDPTHNEYLAVWERDAAGDGTNLDIYSTKLTATGGSSNILIGVASQPVSERNPRVVYNKNLDDFVIVWEAGGTTAKIQAAPIRFSLAPFSLQTLPSVDLSSGAASHVRPDVGTSTQDNSFLAVWEQDAGSGNFDVRSRLLGTFAPTLQVSPAALAFSSVTTHQTLTLTNGSPTGGPLQWTATPDHPWLTAQPGSGSTSSSVAVDVAVNLTGLAPGSYPATVHVASNSGSADVPVTLTVGNHPPAIPSGPQPADGAVDQETVAGGLGLKLAWQGSDPDGDPMTWDVYFDTDATRVTAFDPAVRRAQGLLAPTFQPAGLAFLTTYAWRVVVFDNHGASTPGPVWRFTTAAIAAPALVPVTPDPTRNARPTLAWQAVNGAASYHLQAATDAGFTTVLVDTTGITGTSVVPVTALPEKTIWWHVRAFDGAGRPGPFSAAGSFVVDLTPPAVPVLIAVTPSPTNNRRPTLAWNAVSGAASYRVQVATTPGFAAPLVDATVATLNYLPAADLPEGQIYWRAASLDAAGNQSAFSAASSFVVDVTPPPLVTNLAAHRNGAGVDLTWTPLASPPADLARFRIYRSGSAFTNASGVPLLDQSLTSPAAASYRDTTAAPATAYWYSVTTVDTTGNENLAALVASVPAHEPPTTPVLIAPALGAQVVPGSGASVALAWLSSDPEQAPLRYDVYLSTDSSKILGIPDLGSRIAASLAAPAFTAAGLRYQTTYYWRVAAMDLAADGSPRGTTFGPLWSFVIGAIPAPVLNPVAPDPTAQPQPTFTWQAVPGASAYGIQIDLGGTFTAPVVSTDGLTGTSFMPPAALPEGALFWRVRSFDAQGGTGGYSSPSSFHLDLTPPPAVLGLTAQRTVAGVVLSWAPFASPPSDFDHWNVYRATANFSTVAGMLALDSSLRNVSTTTFTDTTAGTGVVYYYAVTGVDAVGNENRSVVAAMAPAYTLPGAPHNPVPADGATGQSGAGGIASVTLDWLAANPDGTPLSYDLYLSPMAAPVSALDPSARVAQGLSTAGWIASGLSYLTTYYWRVVAFNTHGASTSGPVWSFTVAAIPAPVLISYVPNPTGNSRPTLTWQVVPGASGYGIQIDSSGTFTSPIVNTDGLASGSYTPPTPLPEGNLFWRARAFDAQGRPGPYSSASSVQIDLTPPPAVTGLSVAWSQANVQLNWSAMPPTVTDFDHFNVYRAGAPFTSVAGMTPIATGLTSTSFLDGSVTFGTTYDYAVTAVDKVGNEAKTVTSAPTPRPPGFYTISPCRVLDTRNPTGPYGGPALAAGSQRTFQISGTCGIPVDGVIAVSANITVTGAAGAGDLRMFRADLSTPSLASVISFSAGQTRANNGVLGLSANGGLAVDTDMAGGTVHVIIDVNGYFQ
jgi:RHS repeat-associated protein